MRSILLGRSSWLALAGLLAFPVACGGGDEGTTGGAGPGAAGSGGKAAGGGQIAGGSAGAKAGNGGSAGAGAQPGKGGQGGGPSKGGAAGTGTSGSAGTAASAGASGGGGTSQAGNAGLGGSPAGGGAGGSSGAAGGGAGTAAGLGGTSSGSSGKGGASGGAGGSTAGGAAAAGKAGASGTVQGGGSAGTAGSGPGGQGGATAGGQAGTTGSSGKAGSAGTSVGGGAAGAPPTCANGEQRSCYTGTPDTEGIGACKAGVATCLEGFYGDCTGQTIPASEICDGKDNNCDGNIDEGFPSETCGLGACQITVSTCENGAAKTCVPSPAAPAEICDGLLDNNCDGQVDEGCTCVNGTKQSCYTGSAASLNVGACVAGTQTCAGGAWGDCDDEVLPDLESCNGIDDDCDGNTDEELAAVSCGTGACAVTAPSCLNGVPQTCVEGAPKPETCNQIDDDCDGGTDEDNICCPVQNICGAVCCGNGLVCNFGTCVSPGSICLDATDCAANSYCEYALGDPSSPPPLCQGSTQKNGKCLPQPPTCAPGQPPGDPPVCVSKCEYRPPPSVFTPELKYSWGSLTTPQTADSVMMAPIVIQLDDDNCNGRVDENDIPEIVFSTFKGGNYNGDGTLHAISIVKGAVVEKWTANAGATSPNNPGRQIAAGNIDGKPGNEIVVCTTDGRVRAYDAKGVQLWLSATAGTCFMPSIADLDQDGNVEVIVDSQILNGKDGTTKVAAFTPANSANVVVSDVDGDGKLDIVTGTRAYRANGTLIASGAGAAYPAVGDLNKDGIPEIVATSGGFLQIWQVDKTQPNSYRAIRLNIDLMGGFANPCGSPGGGGGPPTIADFDGDGVPDVAVAGRYAYVVFNGKKLMDPSIAVNEQTVLWRKATQDCSSSVTGSSVFDFNGDGKAEVLYGDELRLHIYAGLDGSEIFSTCNTNGTLWEYPLVADVDNDGHADIVVGSNSYSGYNCAGVKTTGIRIYGDKFNKWVRTRRIWNQHGYHVTNIAEDGTVPKVEATNWLDPTLDNFRQNKQPLGELSAPDLVVQVFPTCVSPYGLVARVRNVGEASVPAGAAVGFYVGSVSAANRLGGGATTKILYPAEGEDITLPLGSVPAGMVIAVVDDGSPAHSWTECRSDNNTSAAVPPTCGGN